MKLSRLSASEAVDVPHVDLPAQYRALRAEIDGAIVRVLEGGSFILGENVRALEEEFGAYCDCAHGVAVGSGTEALHLALAACGVGHGDRVITVPNAAVFPLSAICAVGAEPVLVDVDPKTHCLDPNRLAEYLKNHFEKHTAGKSTLKAIVVVHLYGHAADMDPILELARRYDLRVVEDCAQAHGARYKDRSVGGIGDAGCFSFYPTKNLGAYGDGGMVLTNDEAIAASVRCLRNYGEERLEGDADRSRFVSRGVNSRLDEIQAAVLRVKLEHLDDWTRRRREIAVLYEDRLTSLEVITPATASYAEHVFHLFVIRSQRREALRRHLHQRGVATLIHYPVPVHLQPAYATSGRTAGSFPVAERLAGEILSLPVHAELTDAQVEHVAHAIRKFEEA